MTLFAVLPGDRGGAERVGVFRRAELPLPLRSLHRERELHPPRLLQPRGRRRRAVQAPRLLAVLPQEQDSARRTTE